MASMLDPYTPAEKAAQSGVPQIPGLDNTATARTWRRTSMKFRRTKVSRFNFKKRRSTCSVWQAAWPNFGGERRRQGAAFDEAGPQPDDDGLGDPFMCSLVIL